MHFRKGVHIALAIHFDAIPTQYVIGNASSTHCHAFYKQSIFQSWTNWQWFFKTHDQCIIISFRCHSCAVHFRNCIEKAFATHVGKGVSSNTERIGTDNPSAVRVDVIPTYWESSLEWATYSLFEGAPPLKCWWMFWQRCLEMYCKHVLTPPW